MFSQHKLHDRLNNTTTNNNNNNTDVSAFIYIDLTIFNSALLWLQILSQEVLKKILSQEGNKPAGARNCYAQPTTAASALTS